MPLQGRKAPARRCAGLSLDGGHAPPDAALTPTGACAPWPAAAPRPCARRASACACGTRDGACARACSADRSVSHPAPSSGNSSTSPIDAGSDGSRIAPRPKGNSCCLEVREVAQLIGFPQTQVKSAWAAVFSVFRVNSCAVCLTCA
jgi:hypothetical protein